MEGLNMRGRPRPGNVQLNVSVPERFASWLHARARGNGRLASRELLKLVEQGLGGTAPWNTTAPGTAEKFTLTDDGRFLYDPQDPPPPSIIEAYERSGWKPTRVPSSVPQTRV